MLDAETRSARSHCGVLAAPQARRVALGGFVGRFREAGTSLALILALRGGGSSLPCRGSRPRVIWREPRSCGLCMAGGSTGRERNTVIIAGVATDYCVDATARSALSHRLDVDLSEMATRPPLTVIRLA